ncbi:4-oxalocrotonate tautomerase [Asticcacaulis solisilvae]|uniref:4-oxalocrotonate tautomerase n=1 Tax=Asticcacaulis solisilvae TaxID=1217274 RepID=UPI003FD716BB
MPLQLILTEGVLPEGQEKVAFVRIAEAMLKWHGLADNHAMPPNVIGEYHVLPRDRTFSGMKPAPIAVVEWKVPAFAFADRNVQIGYFDEVTTLIHDMSGGKHPRDHVFINVVHTVDGAWNWGGKALTNDEIKQKVAAG